VSPAKTDEAPLKFPAPLKALYKSVYYYYYYYYAVWDVDSWAERSMRKMAPDFPREGAFLRGTF